MSDTIDRAIELAKHGYRVFPLEPGGKRPALEVSWQKIATADPDQARVLWTDPVTGWPQPYNIGVALPDDIAVIDVDVRDGRKGKATLQALEAIHDPLPNTYRVRTASRGDHYYYRVGTGGSAFGDRLGENVDFKHAGGYVVGEGSVIDGIAYAAIGGSAPDALADLPDAFAEIARKAPRATKPNGHAGQAIAELDDPADVARAIAWLESAEPAVEGDSGDAQAYRTAARVMDFGVSPETCVEIMLDHWNDRCAPPWAPGELTEKVRHAAKYRREPIGVAAPAAEFEPVEIDETDLPVDSGGTGVGLTYWKADDAVVSTQSLYLIEDIYDRGAMVVTYGESGAGKTHVVLDQAVAVATGDAWAAHAVETGLVVYVAAEGGRGIVKRVVAHRQRRGRPMLLAGVSHPIDLLRPRGDTRGLIDLVARAEDDYGAACAMIVIDTLSRALAGGNENAPDDMGALVKNCDRIRAATGATLHIVHHSGKNKAAGARGHSLLRAATDTEIEVSAEGEIKVTKQRDMEFAPPLSFRLEQVRLGTSDRGRPIDTALPVVRQATEFESKVSEGAQAMFDALADLLEKQEKVHWQDWARESLAPRRSMFRYRGELEDAGMVSRMSPESDFWVII